jgi:hypothetical protein
MEAVNRAENAYKSKGGHYTLGGGDYYAGLGGADVTWDSGGGSDCAGFAICFSWRLIRHRPGFNTGAWATVSDDINVDSAIQDADHARELFEPWDALHGPVLPGDLVVYPTIRIPASAPPHNKLTFMGHVGLVYEVPVNWVPGPPENNRFQELTVLQCHGPNGFAPAVVKTDGYYWAQHAKTWPLPQHTSRIIRVKERV